MVGSDCGKPVHIEYDGKAYSDAIVDKQPAPDVETFPPGSRDAVAVEEARLSILIIKPSKYPISQMSRGRLKKADLYKPRKTHYFCLYAMTLKIFSRLIA